MAKQPMAVQKTSDVPLQTRQSGLEGTGEIRLRDLVKETLRMRLSRIMG